MLALKLPCRELRSVWFTDPPYYDAVPYADLSDFFYVWLKRALPDDPLFAILRSHQSTNSEDRASVQDEALRLSKAMPKESRVFRENNGVELSQRAGRC